MHAVTISSLQFILWRRLSLGGNWLQRKLWVWVLSLDKLCVLLWKPTLQQKWLQTISTQCLIPQPVWPPQSDQLVLQAVCPPGKRGFASAWFNYKECKKVTTQSPIATAEYVHLAWPLKCESGKWHPIMDPYSLSLDNHITFGLSPRICICQLCLGHG